MEVIDFGDLPVFQGVTTYPCILRLERGPAEPSFPSTDVKTLHYGDLVTYVAQNGFEVWLSDLTPAGWALVNKETRALLNKLSSTGQPLRCVVGQNINSGIKTGLKEAFVIDAATRARLTQEDAASADHLRPFLAGKDVERYIPPTTSEYLIRVPSGWTDEQAGGQDPWEWFQQHYPALARHLSPYEAKARKRYDQGKHWWELRACRYYDEFERPKILYQEIATFSAFTWDESGLYVNNKIFVLPGATQHLLGLLNSRLVWFFLDLTASKLQGGAYAMQSPYVLQIPVQEPSDDERHEIEQRVDRLLTLHTGTAAEVRARRPEIQRLEKEVDRLVYDLYDLTSDEIALIEARVGK